MGTVRSAPFVTPFADRLLSQDLPGLPSDRRREVVAFTCSRVDGLPSFTRLGVMLIAAVIRLVLSTPMSDTVVRLMREHPLPLLGEYVRLVRSLGYAYVWEAWPDSLPDGATA